MLNVSMPADATKEDLIAALVADLARRAENVRVQSLSETRVKQSAVLAKEQSVYKTLIDFYNAIKFE